MNDEKEKLNDKSAEARQNIETAQDDFAEEASNRIDWESSAFGALLFGLEKYLGRLKITHGFKLNTEPREIDGLVIDKQYSSGKPFNNAIGAIFRRHNVFEFKNPFEALNIDTVCKVISYAMQYKSSGKHVDSIPLDEVTISILRVTKPQQLFKVLEKKGFGIEKKYQGVYYVIGMVCMPLQIVVGSELEGDEFLAFRVLKRKAKKEDIRRFVLDFRSLKGRWKRVLTEAGHSILNASASANRETYKRLRKEDSQMRDALAEIMADDIQKKVDDRNEEIARKMIMDNEPATKIVKFTDVTSSRLGQLANALGVNLITN